MSAEVVKAGQTVMHCGHFVPGGPGHWWRLPKGAMRFRRPDGTVGDAEYVVACEPCAIETGFEPFGIIRADCVLQEDLTIRNEVA